MRWCDGDTREEPRSDEQGRKRATGGGGPPRMGGVGPAQGGSVQGGVEGLSHFTVFLFFIFSSFCIFFLANNDFAKLCHWPKQFQRIKVHCLKKVGRLLE